MSGATAEVDRVELIDVKTVAKMLGISAKHVGRLAAEGAMPAAVRLFRRVRWRRRELLAWIDAGCPKSGGGA